MAANPIQWVEIEAYRRLTFAPLDAWDVRLIRRLDQAVMAVMNPAPGDGQIRVKGASGLASRMRASAAVHNARFKKPKPEGDANV